MNPDMLEALTVLITQIFLGLYVLLLVDFRPPVPKWRRYWFVSVGVLVAGNVAWIGSGYAAQYQRFGYVTLLLPYMLLTLWCSKYRDARTLFGVSNASYVGCVCGINGFVAQLFLPSLWFVSLVVRVISLIAMFFVTRRFSRTCRAMLRQLEHGWLILWMIPLITSVLSMYIVTRFFEAQPTLSALAVYGLLAVCGAAYYLMYLFFEQVQTQTQIQSNRKMLSLQVSALQSRIQAVNAAEERVRVERHDLRHRLQTVRELVQRGETDAALEFVDNAQRRMDDTKPVHWCAAPILDAVFSACFQQAQAQGISVDARLAFPDPLPVEEGELAIVFANALENAIHACMQLPPERRELRCVAIAQPGLMLEISNPCADEVRFDEQGLPIPRREGHGFGTQSIALFCRKYSATCQFELKNGRFFTRVIL